MPPTTDAMDSSVVALGSPSTAPPTPKSRLSPGLRTLVALEAFVSLCGLGGGSYLITHATTALPVRYLGGTWFSTWRWPGVALLVLVGVAPGVVAVATLLRHPLARLGHVCVGVGLVAWVTLEAAWVVVSPPLQITFGAIGLLITILGIVEWRAEGGHRPR